MVGTAERRKRLQESRERAKEKGPTKINKALTPKNVSPGSAGREQATPSGITKINKALGASKDASPGSKVRTEPKQNIPKTQSG